MAVGLLIIRVVLGVVLVGHGAQKLFGWFGGPGLTQTGDFFDSVGHRPGRRMAALAGLAEVTGGALLALGLLTPLGAAIVIGTMIAAAAVHAANGLWASAGGYELPGLYAVAATGLAFTGAGRYSLDHLLGLSWSWPYGIGALVAGLLGALPLIARSRRRLAQSQPREDHRSHQPPTPVAA